MPEEMKKMIMPELKMLANGFALQFALEKNPQTVIDDFNMKVKMLRMSGKLASFTDMIQQEYYDSNILETNSTAYIEHASVSRNDEESKNNSLDFMPDNQRLQILAGIERDRQYAQAQEDMVKKYHLPYKIPERTTKVIISSFNMGDSKGTSKKKKKKQKKFKGIERWNWYHGDWFWVNAAKAYKNMRIEYGHVGLVDVFKSEDHYYAIDSMPGDGVAKHYNLDDYLSSYNKWTVAEGWGYYPEWNPKKRIYESWDYEDDRRFDIMDWAWSKIGKTGYDWLARKRNKNETYCSAFVWQAYQEVNVDLDNQTFSYFVWPQDLKDHPLTSRFGYQKRPAK